MNEDDLETLILGISGEIVEIYEPDVWSTKKQPATFSERMNAVTAKIRELVAELAKLQKQ